MSKPARTAAELRLMLIARIAALPGLGGTALATGAVRIVGIETDGEGSPNWTVQSSVPPQRWRSDVARAIKQLQMEFDFDPEDY